LKNSAVPYPILQSTLGQKFPTKYFIAPLQHHTIPAIHIYPSEYHTSQQLQRVTPTNEEEETYNKYINDLQVIRRTRRKKIHRTQHNIPETKIETRNGYGLLTNETEEDFSDGN